MPLLRFPRHFWQIRPTWIGTHIPKVGICTGSNPLETETSPHPLNNRGADGSGSSLSARRGEGKGRGRGGRGGVIGVRRRVEVGVGEGKGRGGGLWEEAGYCARAARLVGRMGDSGG